jgi:hypothetical protein
MKIRILSVKRDEGEYENPYLAIDYLEWVGEPARIIGTTDREKLYDWIKEAKGVAYIVDEDGNKTFLKPATDAGGKKYVRTVTDETQTDVLLSLPECV